MRRLIALLLVIILVTTSCSKKSADNNSTIEGTSKTDVNNEMSMEDTAVFEEDDINSFTGLDDDKLLKYVEDDVYSKLVEQLNTDEYFVENVSAIYLSKEYIEELEYNSQANVYFGYTVAELDEVFQGAKYVFSLGDDNTTIVKEMETIDDKSYYAALKNIAIGTGVILVCITVSAVTAGSAPAVSMIFAASAKSATSFALSSGVISGVSAGVVTGIDTKNFDEALYAGVNSASEGYKWGAITGVITGGVSETIALKGATLNGLTMNQAASIQKETKWPLEAIKAIHSTEEAKIYVDAGLVPTRLPNGNLAFVKKINWDLVDESGRTNAQRVAENLAPIDEFGKSYELHHIGMKSDSPLAVLSYDEHHSKANYKTLHYKAEGKGISEAEWASQRKEFWTNLLNMTR